MLSVDIIVRIAKFACYAVFRQVFHLGRNLVWMARGTYWEAYHFHYDRTCYFTSAHVQNIFGRYKIDKILGVASCMDFILTHNRFENPEYVLKDNVTLYRVTKDTAIFVEVAENIDVWRAEHGSFLRQAQYEKAKRIITMPLHSFHSLAEKIGQPTAQLVFVQNVARCGSTLLVRFFEETGHCVSFCEPDSLNGVASYTEESEQWQKDKLVNVTRDVVRVLCKPVKSVPKPLAYMMKMTILSIEGVPVLKQIYPHSAHLFMYRDSQKVSESLTRARRVLPLLDITLTIHTMFPYLAIEAVKRMGLPISDYLYTEKTVNPMHGALLLWTLVMDRYMYMRDKGYEMGAIAYEDIQEDPDYAIKAIFKYCGLSEQLVDKAKNALTKDAQSNSDLSSANLKTKKVDVTMSDYTIKNCNKTLQRAGFPHIGQPCYVPGTITHKQPIQWPPQYDSPQPHSENIRLVSNV